jgi:hypothetical protein
MSMDEVPSFSAPMQSAGISVVVKLKLPPRLAVVAATPSHEIAADLGAWPPETVTTPFESVALALRAKAGAAPMSNSAAVVNIPDRLLSEARMSFLPCMNRKGREEGARDGASGDLAIW